MAKRKPQNRPTYTLDPEKLAMFAGLTKLAFKYWGNTPGMFVKMEDGAWGINTSGIMPERLGFTLEEAEEYMKTHPKTKEGEMEKFTEFLLANVPGLTREELER